MLGKHWAIVWSRVSSAHPFIIALKHEKAKPTHRPNSNCLHPQVLAHMWVRIRIHGVWGHLGSMAVERWVGVGKPRERGRWGEGDPGKEGGREEKGSQERGEREPGEGKRDRGSKGNGKEGERRRDSHLHPGPPTRHLERATGERGRPAASGMPGGGPGREADLGRGARARAPSRAPSERRDPSPRGSAAPAPPRPLPPTPRAADRAVWLSRQRRESEAEQTLGELFPLAWKFIGNTCSGEAGHGRGRGGNFPLRLAGGSGPDPAGLPAAPARRRRPAAGRPSRTQPGATPQGPARGPRGARGGEWERGGEGGETGLEPRRGGGVQPYLDDFPLECTSSCSR